MVGGLPVEMSPRSDMFFLPLYADDKHDIAAVTNSVFCSVGVVSLPITLKIPSTC